MKILALLCTLCLLLVGCSGANRESDPRYKAMRAKECAIYFTIDGYLKDIGQAGKRPIAYDCPQSLRDIADMSPIDPPVSLASGVGKNLYDTLIERGVPQEVAQSVSRSKGFKDWVELTIAAHKRF